MRRELAKSARELLRDRVERDAERIWQAYSGALEAVTPDGSPDYRARYQGASALLAEAYGKPVQPTADEGGMSISLVLPDWAVGSHRRGEAGAQAVSGTLSDAELAETTGMSRDELAARREPAREARRRE